MDASTLTTATFTLSSGSGPVTGTVGYSGTTATFTPSASLTGTTIYTATITTGAKDAAGNALAANYVWSFTTGTAPDTTPPTFTGLELARMLNTTTAILAWSAATDDTSPASGIRYFIYIATSSGGHNFSSPQFITTPGITTYEVSGLSPGQVYYFVVKAVDASGNADSNTLEKAVALVEWHDPIGAPTPLNKDAARMADEPTLAFNNGQIYAAWVEKNGIGINQAYMGYWNGTNWISGDSLNVDTGKGAVEATVAFKDTTPYVAWSEGGNVYVKQMTGGSWQLLGGSLAITDPGFLSPPVATIGHYANVIPETPHVGFTQTDIAGVEQLYVKRWNGATLTWDLLAGSNPSVSLNVNPGQSADEPVLTYIGTVPYVVWKEGSQGDVYVYRWNGLVWQPVGGKLNSGQTASGHHSWITSNGETVYVSWVEKDGSGVFQTYVARWTGTDWLRLGGSLNADTKRDANNSHVATAANGSIYAAWVEKDDAGVNQLYVRHWDGNSWILDGGSLNVDPHRRVTEPHIAVNGNAPYATWVEVDDALNLGLVYVKFLP